MEMKTTARQTAEQPKDPRLVRSISGLKTPEIHRKSIAQVWLGIFFNTKLSWAMKQEKAKAQKA